MNYILSGSIEAVAGSPTETEGGTIQWRSRFLLRQLFAKKENIVRTWSTIMWNVRVRNRVGKDCTFPARFFSGRVDFLPVPASSALFV